MSDFSVFLDDIRDWAIRPDWADSTVTTFVRQSESQLSRLMRVKEMIVIADAQVAENRTTLPLDWRELDYVRLNNGEPLTYQSRDDFFREKGDDFSTRYTTVGNYILFGSTDPTELEDGMPVEISYFQAAPKFTDTATWLHSWYYDIFLKKCLAFGAEYSEEVDKATAYHGQVNDLVAAANNEYLVQQVSGSVLRRPRPRRIG
jgi:hypothetical protein